MTAATGMLLSAFDDDDFIEQKEAIYFLDRTPFNQLLFCLAVVEGSTAISQFIQQVHDGIMRQCIDEYNGHAIITHGATHYLKLPFSNMHQCGYVLLGRPKAITGNELAQGSTQNPSLPSRDK